HPRYYRTHCLTVLGLTMLALAFLPPKLGELRIALGAAAVLSLAGSIVWRLEGAPGGQVLNLLTVIALIASLFQLEQTNLVTHHHSPYAALVGDLTSAAL